MQAIQSVSTLFLLLYRTLTRDADVHFSPQGGAVPAGNALLEAFIQGSDSNTVISGFTGSTPIQSLQSALAQIHLSPVTIPGIKQNLIRSASLTFPTNIVNTGVAATSFTLANPFTASINLIQLSATATFHNLTLGQSPTPMNHLIPLLLLDMVQWLRLRCLWILIWTHLQSSNYCSSCLKATTLILDRSPSFSSLFCQIRVSNHLWVSITCPSWSYAYFIFIKVTSTVDSSPATCVR